MNSVDFFGLPAISMGITKPGKSDKDYETLVKAGGDKYRKIILKENRIVGMVFVGDIKSAGIICVLMKNRIDVSPVKKHLMEDAFDYAKILPLVAGHGDKFSGEEYVSTILSYKK
ncbi:MAG: hypothetical protein ABH885_07985 [Candidatus Omnitrophota bacterium]